MAITPSSLANGIAQGIKDFGCAQIALTEPFLNPVFNLYRAAMYPTGPLSAAKAELVIAGITEARNYFSRFACNEPPANLAPLDFSPGFSGGQCPFFYTGRFRITINFNNGTQSVSNVGPVGIPGPIVRFFMASANPSNPGLSWNLYYQRQGETNPRVIATGFGNPNNSSTPQIEVTLLVPESGQPDNCGNPEPRVPSGSPSEGGEIDIVGEDENGAPVTLPDIPFTLFNPTLNVNGDLVLNVEVNLPGAGPDGEDDLICGIFTFGNQGGFEPGSCGPSNRPGRPSAQAPDGDGTDIPDPAFDEEEDLDEEVEEGETIIGVIIKSQKSVTNISQTQAPNGEGPIILIPRIAAVSFRTETETGNDVLTGWSDAQDLRSVDAYYPAPAGVRVTNSSVKWQPNWEGTKQNIVGPWPPEPLP